MTKIPANQKYYEAVGRRKTAVARVRIYASDKSGYIVNNQEVNEFFNVPSQINAVRSPIQNEAIADDFIVSARVSGGGMTSQSEAVRHGIARALVMFNEDYKTSMKAAGFIKRDPRKKERKKPGLRKARKAPQWSKR